MSLEYERPHRVRAPGERGIIELLEPGMSSLFTEATRARNLLRPGVGERGIVELRLLDRIRSTAVLFWCLDSSRVLVD